jgi:hypothetical protein
MYSHVPHTSLLIREFMKTHILKDISITVGFGSMTHDFINEENN